MKSADAVSHPRGRDQGSMSVQGTARSNVADHYANSGLVAAIRDGLIRFVSEMDERTRGSADSSLFRNQDARSFLMPVSSCFASIARRAGAEAHRRGWQVVNGSRLSCWKA